jgi:hypothetical protein
MIVRIATGTFKSSSSTSCRDAKYCVSTKRSQFKSVIKRTIIKNKIARKTFLLKVETFGLFQDG